MDKKCSRCGRPLDASYFSSPDETQYLCEQCAEKLVAAKIRNIVLIVAVLAIILVLIVLWTR